MMVVVDDVGHLAVGGCHCCCLLSVVIVVDALVLVMGGLVSSLFGLLLLQVTLLCQVRVRFGFFVLPERSANDLHVPVLSNRPHTSVTTAVSSSARVPVL